MFQSYNQRFVFFKAGEVKKVWGKKCEEAIVVFHQKSEEFGVIGRKFIDDSYTKTVSFLNDLNLKETALNTAGLVQEKSAQYFDQFLVATGEYNKIIIQFIKFRINGTFALIFLSFKISKKDFEINFS